MKHAWAFSIALMTAACGEGSPLSCDGRTDCLAVGGSLILGGTEADRKVAMQAFDTASTRFALWDAGQVPAGYFYLSAPLAAASPDPVPSQWELTWDPVQAELVRGALATGLRQAAGSRATPIETVRFLDDPHGVSEDDADVLAHEICHRLGQALRRTVSADRVPEVIDEMSALSCEPRDALEERRSAYLALRREGRTVVWSEMFTMNHPLKASARMQAVVAELEASGRSGMTFKLTPDDAEFGDTALYYGQAATLVLYLTEGSCAGNAVVGRLITDWRRQDGLEGWLARNAEELCLPNTPEALNASLEASF